MSKTALTITVLLVLPLFAGLASAQVQAPTLDPVFAAFPEWDDIEGWNWELGATVHVTIDDPSTPGSPDHTEDLVVEPQPPDWPAFHLHLTGYDLKAGDEITVSVPGTSLTHTVRHLTITGTDPVADTVAGTADEGALVHVWPHGYGAYEVQVTVGASETWVADFTSVSFDLVAGTCGRSEIRDAALNRTAVDWCVPNPRITAFPEWNAIEGWEWALGETVHLEIDDPATGASPDYEGDEIVGTHPDDPARPWLWFELAGVWDLKPGDELLVSTPEISRTHTVRSLAITGVFPEADQVTGMAAEGEVVHVWPHEYGQYELQLLVGADETWLADFSAAGFDVGGEICGRSDIRDESNNSTAVDWCSPQPRIFANLAEDHIRFEYSLAGASVTFSIFDEPGGTLLWSDIWTADPIGSSIIWPWNHHVDLEPGMFVVVTDGVSPKELVIEPVSLDVFDSLENILAGTAAPGRQDVWAVANNDSVFCGAHVTADASGNWSVDFDEQDPVCDVTRDMWAYAQVTDDDGDTSEFNLDPLPVLFLPVISK